MSRLLRPSHPPSYSKVPQNSHIDDNDADNETILSPRGQGNRHLCPHWSQLAAIIVLLLLAGTAGFFVGLFFSQSQLTSSIPDTVPQGLLSSQLSRHSLTCYLSVTTGLSKETFRYNESFAAPPPDEGGQEPIWDSLIPSMDVHFRCFSQQHR